MKPYLCDAVYGGGQRVNHAGVRSNSCEESTHVGRDIRTLPESPEFIVSQLGIPSEYWSRKRFVFKITARNSLVILNSSLDNSLNL